MQNSDQLNPWFSMWNRPRDTIQQIVDSDDPEKMVLLLAAIGGVSSSLNSSSSNFVGDQFSLMSILLASLFIGPIVGVIGLYISGFLVSWTGKWIGGHASSNDIRIALAWAQIPIIWTVGIWIPEILIFGQELFMSPDENGLILTAPYAFFAVGFFIVKVTASLWAFVLLLKSVGQVQGFSAWKALWNLIIPGLLFLIPVILIAILAGAAGQ